jgi:hypothetical protein
LEAKSWAEHEEVPGELTAMETVRALKKRYGDGYLAVRRRRQLQKGAQGDGGYRKKLAAALRGMVRCAGVAVTQHRRWNRDDQSQRQCCKRNLKIKGAREETSGATGMQQRHKEPRLEGVATSWKREGIWDDFRENHWA